VREGLSRKVFFKACPDYNLENLCDSIEILFEKYGKTLPKKGSKVLLKPNLLKPFKPEAAVTTHPSFVEAIIIAGKKRGWNIHVGDSPAISSVKSVATNTGLLDILKRHDVELIALNKAKTYISEGKHFPIAQQLDNYDAIINLPKLKGHQQLYMTAAVKNLFGCVPGKRKAMLHLKIGDQDDGTTFAKMLLNTAKEVNPVINIIDAITSMAGNGPTGGSPCQTGFIGICDDPLSLDLALLKELNGDLQSDPIYRCLSLSSEFSNSKNYCTEWLGEKPDLSAFYFPTQRQPISFHPFVIIRFIFRMLLSKIIKPAHANGKTL
jgi:uncharacterized protein (DUF362 family)